MIRLNFTIIVCFISLSSFGQTNDSLNFTYWTPQTWFSGDKNFQKDNLNNYKFSKKQIDQLVNEVNASTILGIYYKYDPQRHYGLVPTMKFYIRQNYSTDFDKFFLSIKNEIEGVKSQVINFKYVVSPTTKLINNRKSFYATSTYNLNVQTGEVASVRTTFVCIPLGKKFLYVTLMDNEKEDCTDVYNEVIDKIRIE